jgi:hypothetical protein
MRPFSSQASSLEDVWLHMFEGPSNLSMNIW